MFGVSSPLNRGLRNEGVFQGPSAPFQMPVHQIFVVPISGDSADNGNDCIQSTSKRNENEAHGSSQGAALSGTAQPFHTTSCQETYRNDSTLNIPVSHADVTRQQAKRRYRCQRSVCADSDSSSGEEQYHRAARSWSQEKARRRRHPRLLTRSHEEDRALTTSWRTSLELKELETKSEDHRECAFKTSTEEEEEEEDEEQRPVMKPYKDHGSGNANIAVATAEENAEACGLNGTLQEACADNELQVCRICHGEGDEECALITPCRCIGSLRFVHHACLHRWIKSSDTRCCELCKYNFAMETQLKPLREWENLQMSTNERRSIFCAVIFHLVAVACVAGSLYVSSVTNHAAEGVQSSKEHHGLLEWLFWTKLGIVALGATSGFIFMSIQCKVYLNMWRRLKAFNSIIVVHNCLDSMRQIAEKTTPPKCSSTHQTLTTAQCSALEGRSAEVEPV